MRKLDRLHRLNITTLGLRPYPHYQPWHIYQHPRCMPLVAVRTIHLISLCVNAWQQNYQSTFRLNSLGQAGYDDQPSNRRFHGDRGKKRMVNGKIDILYCIRDRTKLSVLSKSVSSYMIFNLTLTKPEHKSRAGQLYQHFRVNKLEDRLITFAK